MPISLSEILSYVFGSTTLVSIYMAWKSRTSTIKQAEATTLESIDAIYEKMTKQVGKEFEKMSARIVELETKLEGYVKQCAECSFNNFPAGKNLPNKKGK